LSGDLIRAGTSFYPFPSTQSSVRYLPGLSVDKMAGI